MTPLLAEIEDYAQRVEDIREGRQLDDLDSISHVKIIGLFKEVLNNGEIMGQLVYSQSVDAHRS